MSGPHPSAPKRGAPPYAKDRHERVVGVSAARAVMAVRAHDVLHIVYAPEARGALSELLRGAARQRIAYREVASEELAKIAHTVHHEGVCLQVRARKPVSLVDLATRLGNGGFVVALDGVLNPHNIGALLRSAAYFGAVGMVVAGTNLSALTPSTVRVAEGGAEYVPVSFVSELGEALDVLLQCGAELVGADAHGGESLSLTRFSGRSVLILGNERSGLSDVVQKRCHRRVHVAGSGQLESLNVSVAAGILMAHARVCQRGP